MTASRLDLITAADLPMRFGRYQLQSLLGEGGMARVFQAELLGPAGFRKQVAVKVIKAEANSSATSRDVASFIREARLGGLLKHPNIVDVYELGGAGGQFFLAMELVDGPTLSELILSKTPPPPAVVLEIAMGAAAGLSSAHSLSSEGLPAGLVHRDLKPSNVLVSMEGAVKIADFGIAITRYGELAESTHGREDVSGTLSYMSPEQLLGQPLDGRSDMFSLGLVLCELATATLLPRRYLFGRIESEGELRAPVLPAEYTAAADAAVPGLGAILLRCLEAIPEARYPTAEALLSALESLRDRVGTRPRLRHWLAERLAPQDQATVAGAVVPHLAPDPSEETVTRVEDSTSIALSSRARTNLGPPLDIFIGRQGELERLRDVFERGARLVTVKGTGGAGKTRFARRLARSQWQELAGGAWFVDLTEARTAMGVVQATAAALGLALRGADLDALVTHLGRSIAGRGPVMLVLDNFEQVLEHAPATLGRWLEIAPEALFLTTSREPLKLAGEQVFLLEPLPADDGVELFQLRAREAGARWQASEASRANILRIVEELDGLPLAIELAAARANLLSPSQLLERLGDRFKLLRGGRRGDTGRQATLRGLIRWSWELLEPWEQAALAQLSVFRGGFFMAAAESVVDLRPWPDAPWSLDVVGSLLEKSLLRSWEVLDQPRFGMYVSIREYAAEKLVGGSGAIGHRATSLRHAAHYGRFGTEDYSFSLDTHGGVERRNALALELENLTWAVEVGLAEGVPEAAAVCSLAASAVYELRGPSADGVALMQRLPRDSITAVMRGRLCRRIGWLLHCGGRLGEALDYYTEGLAIVREAGDRRGEGATLANLGILHHNFGRVPEAQQHYAMALAIQREEGHRQGEGATLGNIAQLEHQQGMIPEALESYRGALTIAREVGNRRSEGLDIGNLALLLKEIGRMSEALEYLRQSLAISRELGNRRVEGVALGNFGDVLFAQGDLAAAEAHLQQAIKIGDEVVSPAAAAFRASLALIRAHQGDFEAARALLAVAEPQLRGLYALEFGKLLCKKARIEHLAGAPDAALAALAGAESVLGELGAPPDSELGIPISQAREFLGA
jgi:predicted ATPase/serine/threonine protein kinase